MAAHMRFAVHQSNELRGQFIDHAFRQDLLEALQKNKSQSHPILAEYTKPVANRPLMRLMSIQRYHLASQFGRYIGGLYHHCPIQHYRKQLAINLYEDETGMLSNTANHVSLMMRFLRAIGVNDDERGSDSILETTQELIDYRWSLVRDKSLFHCAVAAIMIASESQILEEMVAIEHGHLSQLYGFQHDDLAFYNVRAGEDIFHVRDGLDLVAELCKTDTQKQQAVETINETCLLYWRYYDGIVDAYLQMRQAQCV